MRILAVCGAGMGTSVMMKIKLTQFVIDEKINATVESCALDEAKGSLRDYDVVICSKYLTAELGAIPPNITLIDVNNILDIASYGETIKKLAQASR